MTGSPSVAPSLWNKLQSPLSGQQFLCTSAGLLLGSSSHTTFTPSLLTSLWLQWPSWLAPEHIQLVPNCGLCFPSSSVWDKLRHIEENFPWWPLLLIQVSDELPPPTLGVPLLLTLAALPYVSHVIDVGWGLCYGHHHERVGDEVLWPHSHLRVPCDIQVNTHSTLFLPLLPSTTSPPTQDSEGR